MNSGLAFFITCFYKREELLFRIGIYVSAASMAGAFSGLLAYGIGFMSGTGGLQGWSWIFVRYKSLMKGIRLNNQFQILEGLATVVVSLVAFLGMFLKF